MGKQFYKMGIMLLMTAVACQHNRQHQDAIGQMDTVTLTHDVSSLTAADTDVVALEDTLWLLKELNGKTVGSAQAVKGFKPDLEIPSIRFRGEDQKFIAKTDCNGIAGDYKRGIDNSLRFLELFHTEMACPDMEVEKGLLEQLPHVRHYSIEDHQLTLRDSSKTTIARLALHQ